MDRCPLLLSQHARTQVKYVDLNTYRRDVMLTDLSNRLIPMDHPYPKRKASRAYLCLRSASTGNRFTELIEGISCHYHVILLGIDLVALLGVLCIDVHF